MRLNSHMVIPASFAIQTLRQCTVCSQTRLLEIFRQRASHFALPDTAHITISLTLYFFTLYFFLLIFFCTLKRNEVLCICNICGFFEFIIFVRTMNGRQSSHRLSDYGLRNGMCLKSQQPQLGKIEVKMEMSCLLVWMLCLRIEFLIRNSVQPATMKWSL